jgi:peptidoglycan L-alanyl-D-glutamate endopeptidase CwlK
MDAASEKFLIGVHPDLVKVMREARKRVDFRVYEGLRTVEEQRKFFRQGSTKIDPDNPKHPKGRHLTGHAVDIIPLVNGKGRFDWPLYHAIAPVIKQVAKEHGVDIVWGGDWKKFPDGPHFELSYTKYPA